MRYSDDAPAVAVVATISPAAYLARIAGVVATGVPGDAVSPEQPADRTPITRTMEIMRPNQDRSVMRVSFGAEVYKIFCCSNRVLSRPQIPGMFLSRV
jgi:hypothetical protein